MVVVNGKVRYDVRPSQIIKLQKSKRLTVMVGGRWHKVSDTVFCQAGKGVKLKVGNRRYRGSLLGFVSSTGELVLVNELRLEDYLCGVVPCEIGPINEKTFEAVKAQAIAARNFTLTRLKNRKGLGFQLYDSYKRDQEYHGFDCEVELANRAVKQTRGEVLLYRSKLVKALYHANCGGRTKGSSEPYLKSIRDTPGHRPGHNPFCANGKHYSWRVTFSKNEFEHRLANLVHAKGRIRLKSFHLEKHTDRVSRVKLVTDKGVFNISGADFRQGIGLNSTVFDMSVKSRKVTISGRGWGHGAGMCQEGALEMARRGYNCKQILLHYYSGVKLSRIY